MPNWLSTHEHGCLLLVYVRPGAFRSELAGEHGGRLKIKIKAPPREGQANEALQSFLAEVLGIAKSKIFLIRGESSRQKDLVVELSQDEVLRKLEGLLDK